MQTPPRQHLRVRDSARQKQNVVTWRKHKRGFKEIPLRWVGHQCGKLRYPRRDAQNNILPKVPPLNAWRNNLTGLSQHFNLYIVACNDSIQVYNPRFPEQLLSNEPLLKWKLPVSAPNLRGHMPTQPGIPHSPHSVNNVLISDLGDIEVMVCACDDGDVIVYPTKTLLGPRKPRSLFHFNVGRSAWGLAVHKEARMIAVSANTHEITVFVPALVTAGCDSHETSLPETTNPLHTQLAELTSNWDFLKTAPDKLDDALAQSPNAEAAVTHHRHSDKIIRLKHHVNNIPSISFCNTYDERIGAFLASTDICGIIIIWDVMNEKTLHIVSYRTSMYDQPMFDHYDMSRSGWGLLFLDRKCFAPTKSIVQAMGVCNKISLWVRPNQISPSVQIYDISHSQSKVQKASQYWNLNWRSPTNSAQPFSVPEAPSFNENEQNPLAIFLDISSDDENEQVDDNDVSSDGESTPTGNVPISPRLAQGPLSGQPKDLLYHNMEGRITEDRIGTETAFGLAATRRWPMLSNSVKSNESESVLPSVPLLFLQPNNVHLFQSAAMDWCNGWDHQQPSPLVMIHDPLEQSVPNEIRADLAQCDRLNLYSQIPELGVVLVGSPKGRVAVLSLHLLEPDLEPLTGLPRTDINNPLYTMRLDYILPFAHEEADGKRPLQQLVGLAAGPIHGEQNLKQLRYRIMLTYQDHSVLSYEIGREGSDSYRDVKMY